VADPHLDSSSFHAGVDRLRWEGAEASILNTPLGDDHLIDVVVGVPPVTPLHEAAETRTPNAFEQILSIAQEQLDAVSRGDLEAAVARLDQRGVLVAQLPIAQARDTSTLEEIMRLDRVLSGAIRDRMLAIREESDQLQHRTSALDLYA
jgi:hypothetical protein